MEPGSRPLIGIVGPCAAGKTTLVSHLLERNINARLIAQEHSYVPAMWQKITNPVFLIYLGVSYEVTIQRSRLNWTMAEYEDQLFRLRHARENANLVIQTDSMTPDAVADTVLDFLARSGHIIAGS